MSHEKYLQTLKERGLKYKCKFASLCEIDCNHKEPHIPFVDGGSLPCNLHVHCCIGKDGKSISHEYDGACLIEPNQVGG